MFQPRRLMLAPPVSHSVGPCFACSEMGHLQGYCPKSATPETQEVVSLHTVDSNPIDRKPVFFFFSGPLGGKSPPPTDKLNFQLIKLHSPQKTSDSSIFPLHFSPPWRAKGFRILVYLVDGL